MTATGGRIYGGPKFGCPEHGAEAILPLRRDPTSLKTQGLVKVSVRPEGAADRARLAGYVAAAEHSSGRRFGGENASVFPDTPDTTSQSVSDPFISEPPLW